jgi:hypothetical protein
MRSTRSWQACSISKGSSKPVASPPAPGGWMACVGMVLQPGRPSARKRPYQFPRRSAQASMTASQAPPRSPSPIPPPRPASSSDARPVAESSPGLSSFLLLPIHGAEVVSAPTGISLKSLSGPEQAFERNARRLRTAHLRDAIVQTAKERSHSVADVARIMDISAGHLYRLKQDPMRLGRLSRERLDAIANYVGWPRVQVMLAVGWLQPDEVGAVISLEGAVQRALHRLEHGAFANGVRTPLAQASADHQLLMARLLIAAEGAAVGSAVRV